MAEMRDYLPHKISEATEAAYLKEWKWFANRFGLAIFEKACHAVMRRSDYFPLPKVIADECRSIHGESEVAGATFSIWSCEKCWYSCAGTVPPRGCEFCTGDMILVQGPSESDVEMKQYYEDLKAHPERFVSVREIFAEAIDKLKRKTAMP